MSDLRVTVDGSELAADWVEANPGTRAAIAGVLPVEERASRWGDELYLSAGADAAPEETAEVVPEGAVAYWPAGDALCLFWGPTPASRDDEPRAASPVGVVARIEDVGPLRDVDGSATVRVEEL